MNESFGMMGPEYFVNKNEILRWINNTLKLRIEKVDHLGNGAVYCQLVDLMYPGTIAMSKVNWKAKLEYECLHNFKIFSTCLEKNDVKKNIEVNKLVKCKHQDNLEFAQWFKRFFDSKCGASNASDYDPIARRGTVNSSSALLEELPKVARKSEKSFEKLDNAACTFTTSKSPAVTTTTSKKQQLNNSINAKRPFNLLLQSSSRSNIINSLSPSQPSTATQYLLAPTAESQERQEYNLLMNSIKYILTQGDCESDMVNKIKSLIGVTSSLQFAEDDPFEDKENIRLTGQQLFHSPTPIQSILSMEQKSV